MKYPLLHTNYLKEVVNIYNGISTLSSFGHEIGLNYVVRWNEVGSFYMVNWLQKSFLYIIKLKFIQSTDLYISSTVTDSEDQSESTHDPVPYTVKIGHAVAGAVQAIVGALYLDKVNIVKQNIVYRFYYSFLL